MLVPAKLESFKAVVEEKIVLADESQGCVPKIETNDIELQSKSTIKSDLKLSYSESDKNISKEIIIEEELESEPNDEM